MLTLILSVVLALEVIVVLIPSVQEHPAYVARYGFVELHGARFDGFPGPKKPQREGASTCSWTILAPGASSVVVGFRETVRQLWLDRQWLKAEMATDDDDADDDDDEMSLKPFSFSRQRKRPKSKCTEVVQRCAAWAWLISHSVPNFS